MSTIASENVNRAIIAFNWYCYLMYRCWIFETFNDVGINIEVSCSVFKLASRRCNC